MKPGFDINLFYVTFVCYFVGFLAFSLYAALKKDFWHKLGRNVMMAGLLPHTGALIFRWTLSGHVPLSNMYEYMSLMSWMAVVTLLYIYFRFNKPAIGVFLTPVVFMLMVAASLLPKDMSQSLMPALQSVWLAIHVSMAALGAGCFLIAFAGSAIYLIRKVEWDNYRKNEALNKVMRRWTWICLAAFPIAASILLSTIGATPPTPESHFGPVGGSINAGGFFSIAGISFILGVIALGSFWPGRKGGDKSGYGGWLFIALLVSFLVGGLLVGLFMKINWLEFTHNLPTPDGNETKSAWLIFEFFGASYVGGLVISPLFLYLLAKLSQVPAKSLPISLELLDEIAYKSVSLAYPLWTIGALFAGAIWAEQAWGGFWSWDPKEVGALIVWLFFSGYLHARYQRGWTGSRAAVLAVCGFMVVLLSFFGNYFFGGMHAYA